MSDSKEVESKLREYVQSNSSHEVPVMGGTFFPCLGKAYPTKACKADRALPAIREGKIKYEDDYSEEMVEEEATEYSVIPELGCELPRNHAPQRHVALRKSASSSTKSCCGHMTERTPALMMRAVNHETQHVAPRKSASSSMKSCCSRVTERTPPLMMRAINHEETHTRQSQLNRQGTTEVAGTSRRATRSSSKKPNTTTLLFRESKKEAYVYYW